MLEAVDDVLAYREREEIGGRADVGERAPGDRLGSAREIDPAELDRAVRRHHQPREELRELARAARRPPDDRDVLLQRALERHAVDHARAGIVVQRDGGDFEPAIAGQLGRLQRRLQLGGRRFLGGELLDHLVVLDLDVEALLVPVDQLLHRRRQVLVRRDDRDQRTDIQLADDDEVAAHRIEEEGRHLRQEVVEELDQELALVELEADAKDPSQPGGDLGAFPVRRIVRVDLRRAVDTLGNAPGERTRGELALAAEHEQALSQPRDDDRLHADHGKRDQPEPDLLIDDEEHRRKRLPAEEERRDERFADEAAERLDLVLDHGRHLGGLHAPEARQRKAQDVVEEGVAQPAQHALAHPALHRVDLELEPAVEHDQAEEQARQREEIRDALEVQAEEALHRVGAREAHALDRLVDDGLRQVERQVVDHHRRDHQRHDQQLIALAVSNDEAEETAFHLEKIPCYHSSAWGIRHPSRCGSGACADRSPARVRAPRVTAAILPRSKYAAAISSCCSMPAPASAISARRSMRRASRATSTLPTPILTMSAACPSSGPCSSRRTSSGYGRDICAAQ